MNLLTGTSLVWRALRGRSVTIAAVFASALLGSSVVHWLRLGLKELGVGSLGLIFAPIFLVTLLARKEPEWLPDENLRRRWSYGLVVGSLFLAIALARVKPAPPENSPLAPEEESAPPSRPHRPPGK